MSHDIDLIVTRPQLEIIGSLVEEVSETHHLAGRKWRGTLEGIHLDLYVPYQSLLGQHLQLRTEVLIEHMDRVDDWNVLTPAAHLATKLTALLDRPDSHPGDKDRQEILSLLALDISPDDAVRVVHEASTRTAVEVDQQLKDAFQYLTELTLDRPQRSWLRGLAAEWADTSRRFTEAQIPDQDIEGHPPPGREPPGPALGR